MSDRIEKLLTLDGWNAMGRRVRKGEKACARNGDGKALFSTEQTYAYTDRDEATDTWCDDCRAYVHFPACGKFRKG